MPAIHVMSIDDHGVVIRVVMEDGCEAIVAGEDRVEAARDIKASLAGHCEET